MIRLMTEPGRAWDPWRELGRLRDEIDRGVARFSAPAEYPLVNVHRLPDRLVLEALIPGADRSTLHVTTVGNTLTVRGERATEPGVDPAAYHRREREVGRFVRTMKLDERVATENVAATYRDGILRIELPYAPETKPRKVEIQS